MKAIQHFCTITHHKLKVMESCFRVGLYRQGIMHDLSKYSPQEFLAGCQYFQGNRSPNNAEREAKGYSEAWMHHKGRNRHHYEYWNDYSLNDKKGTVVPVKMPKKYVVEMFLDRIAASKIYNKEKYTDRSPWEYYHRGRDYQMMHPDTKKLLEHLLKMLATKGEDYTFSYIRNKLLKTKEY